MDNSSAKMGRQEYNDERLLSKMSIVLNVDLIESILGLLFSIEFCFD